jgi:hypothetical protein
MLRRRSSSSRAPVTVPVTDLTGLPPARRRPAMRTAVRAQMRVPFDPGVLPLARWHLYKLSEKDWTLFQAGVLNSSRTVPTIAKGS